MTGQLMISWFLNNMSKIIQVVKKGQYGYQIVHGNILSSFSWNGYSRITSCFDSPWVIMTHHELLWVIINHYESPWVIMSHRESWSRFIQPTQNLENPGVISWPSADRTFGKNVYIFPLDNSLSGTRCKSPFVDKWCKKSEKSPVNDLAMNLARFDCWLCCQGYLESCQWLIKWPLNEWAQSGGRKSGGHKSGWVFIYRTDSLNKKRRNDFHIPSNEGEFSNWISRKTNGT